MLLDVDPSKVPAGVSQTTLSLSAVGAQNTAEIKVSVSKDKPEAPSDLKASHVPGSPKDVIFSWEDNSDGEDGFIIQMCSAPCFATDDINSCFGHDGEYGTEIARVGANVAEYVWNNPNGTEVHCSNHYRVVAFTGEETSAPSNYARFFTSQSRPPVSYETTDGWITVTYPKRGFVYQTGQSLPIRWISDDVAHVNIEYSIDYGASWIPIAQSIASGSALHQSYEWYVPTNLDGKNAIIRVIDADDPDIRSIRISFAKDIHFGESAAVNVAGRDRAQATRFSMHMVDSEKAIRLAYDAVEGMNAAIYHCNGRKVMDVPLRTQGATLVPISNMGHGTYVIQVTGSGVRQFRSKFTIVD